MLAIKYFASLRDQLNSDGEQIPWRAEFATVADVKQYLSSRNQHWLDVLSQNTLLVAVNHEMGDDRTALRDGDELAFLPPVTGG